MEIGDFWFLKAFFFNPELIQLLTVYLLYILGDKLGRVVHVILQYICCIF